MQSAWHLWQHEEGHLLLAAENSPRHCPAVPGRPGRHLTGLSPVGGGRLQSMLKNSVLLEQWGGEEVEVWKTAGEAGARRNTVSVFSHSFSDLGATVWQSSGQAVKTRRRALEE